MIRVFVVIGSVVAFLGAAVAGVWRYTGLVKRGVLDLDRDDDPLDLRVVGLADGTVRLELATDEESRDWKSHGIFGVEWSGGYGQVGEIKGISDGHVEREFFPLKGTLAVGDAVRLDSFALPDDPQVAHGIAFEEVTFASELGEFPAWFVPGSSDTWAIFVHGKGANRREALRMLPTVVDAGLPSLVITYRNDEGLPENDDGYYRYGATEWKELKAAVDYVVERGAKRIVLIGYSMGGAIVTNYMLQSAPGELVPGVIMDSPALNLEAIVVKESKVRGIPGLVATLGKVVFGWRSNMDWAALNYLSRADELKVPILLFHGDRDGTVFVETSDAFAEARPDIVTYVRATDVDHVRSWNADHEGYEAKVREFLARVVD
ncbi:MAG: alpha/beta fold hydrolase [Chloroflexi bacterium]|nr:alpha/beta fold hydrolase [Chloroflexota bacterium]